MARQSGYQVPRVLLSLSLLRWDYTRAQVCYFLHSVAGGQIRDSTIVWHALDIWAHPPQPLSPLFPLLFKSYFLPLPKAVTHPEKATTQQKCGVCTAERMGAGSSHTPKHFKVENHFLMRTNPAATRKPAALCHG